MGTEYLVGVLVLCGLIAMGVGREKGRGLGDSFLFGVFLGPIGVILVAVLPPPAPKGMRSVTCTRCNARQNVERRQSTYDCWQCKTTVKA